MGTSVSQPSPKGSVPGAPEWKDAKETVSAGSPPARIIDGVLAAFGAQYGTAFSDTLVDAGVQKVAEILTAKLSTAAARDEKLVGNFIVDARKALAQSHCNSFFAELALSAGSKAILQGGDNPQGSFAAEYATKVVDYAVSRDLPATFGSAGLTNLESLKTLLGGVHKEFEAKAQKSSQRDGVGIIKQILNPPRRSNT